jgi:pyruvate dehydrogenase E1 component alpha subunit
MTLAREADQRMLKLQRQGRIGTFAPCTGQEATAVGAAYAMGKRDWFVGAFRELGGRLVRGEPFVNTLLFHAGYEEGNVQPGGSQRLLPFSIIVGAQLLHAVGIGYAIKYRQEDAAVVAFCGDGATSEGDFHEALNFAAVWQAPVVFVVQNNQWAISIPRRNQTRSATLAQKAIGYGMPGLQVDGNDVLAMYRATREALQRAYRGQGPTLLEAETYRLLMHTTSDDPTRYRTDDEVTGWQQKDPLLRLRRFLEARGAWSADPQTALEAAVKAQIDQAVQEFEQKREFKPDAPFDHVFATPHPSIEEQRQRFLAQLPAEVKHG